jgi:hypothetical protein
VKGECQSLFITNYAIGPPGGAGPGLLKIENCQEAESPASNPSGGTAPVERRTPKNKSNPPPISATAPTVSVVQAIASMLARGKAPNASSALTPGEASALI